MTQLSSKNEKDNIRNIKENKNSALNTSNGMTLSQKHNHKEQYRSKNNHDKIYIDL